MTEIWSVEAVTELKSRVWSDQAISRIAQQMGRTDSAVRQKATELGLKRPKFWNQQRVKTCKDLYDKGLSSSQIGKVIGATRNAIIGIWHRHPDVFLPRPHIVNGKSTKKLMRARGPRHQLRREVAPVFEPTPIIKRTIEPPPDDFSLWPVTIVESAEHHCRFPVWGRPYLMCGADKIKGHSYCGWHCRIAYASDKRALRQGGFRLRTWAA